MRPHFILEQMAEFEAIVGDRLKEVADTEVWEGCKAFLARAVTFDFGDYAPSQEHAEFGIDLMDRGLYRAPFSTTFFSWRGAGIDQGMLVVSAKSWTDNRDGWLLVTIGTTQLEGNASSLRMPTTCCLLAQDDPMNSPAPLMSVFVKAQQRNRAGELIGQQERQAIMGRALRFAAGAASMLMCRDVTTRVDAAPAKLNAQRAKKGRPPIGDVHTVKIQASVEREYIEAGREFGTHASPKMHWRRGHFRTLRRGEENQKVVPVAPSLVGGNETAKGIAPKEYVIT